MSAKRRDVRENAFILIFETLFHKESVDKVIETARETNDVFVNDEVSSLVHGVCEKADELDNIISKYSNKRAVERIPKINLAILRLAIYEAMYDEKVPVNVAISEAVTLAGKYAQAADVAFVNGILGSYSRSDEAPENE